MPLIPSPPKAFARKDAVAITNIPSKAIGTKVLGIEGQRRRKKPEQQMHKIESKNPTTKPYSNPEPEHPVIVYLKEQAEIREEDDFVFLLWGSSDSEVASTYAVDVAIPDRLKTEANYEKNITPWISTYDTLRIQRHLREEEVFSALKKQYYAEIGPLCRHFFFRKVARFQFISRIQGRFKVSMEPVDLSGVQMGCHKIIAEMHEKINWDHFENPDFHEDPDLVPRCEDCGQKECNTYYECLGTDLDECPGRQRNEAKAKLRWVRNADLLTFYFHNPSFALGQNMLSSSPYNLFGQWKQMKYFGATHQQNWSGEKGLYIETCFDTTRLLRATLILLILVIILGKLAWGSWDIVFGAGSFFVAIPILVLTTLSYTDC